MMRFWLLTILLAISVGRVAAADELREPLEKQFFDYFVNRCTDGMNAEISASGKDPNESRAAKAVEQYCSCTSQAIVSFLSAEEIISFANNPEREPASSKMRPHFVKCQGK